MNSLIHRQGRHYYKPIFGIVFDHLRNDKTRSMLSSLGYLPVCLTIKKSQSNFLILIRSHEDSFSASTNPYLEFKNDSATINLTGQAKIIYNAAQGRNFFSQENKPVPIDLPISG
jgi:hypothetical protein